MAAPRPHDLGPDAGAQAAPAKPRLESMPNSFRRAQDRISQAAAELALAEQNRRFDAALSNMPHGLCMFDDETRLILCNAAYRRLYALPERLTRPGTPLQDILNHRIATGSAPVDWVEYREIPIESALRGGDLINRHVQLEDGRTIQITHNPIPGGGYVASHEDVTEILAAAADRHLARHDPLTGLPNRVLLHERLDRALARSRPTNRLSVLCVDLDHFKAVNDTLGHPVGDDLLRAVAGRLSACVRENDTVARLGGDEFVVLLPDGQGRRQVETLARRLIETVSTVFEIQGHRITIGASIGVAIAPGDGDHAEPLLANADLALYRAKAEGRGTACFFEPGMDALAEARRKFEQDLGDAAQAERFELHYQPEVDTRTGAIVGFEALLRWNRPGHGMVAAADFIALAEETGLIAHVDDWVIGRACADAAGWPKPVRVAVNLSPTAFRSRTLVGAVARALADSGLAPARLELEIGEAVLRGDGARALAILHQLRGLGVRIALDDFGTGHSSLDCLRLFSFDKVKIDPSFIAGLSEPGPCAAIVRAVTRLGAALGFVTTAEGVETADQLAQLREQGCDTAQGYLLGRAGPADEVPALFAQQRRCG
ncbi:diguanylate cyclase (GGDEF)-like protein [Caulobacter rhizosphaerae]|uniref:Diguanylate cyclase (GGDEF)-like protein n=1 Tax=Caulobacter rhizosphaerae TaxID=2010972 RepID=A0ABU1N4W8_9CAUL|nr:EAL domain-containing protein [Caulobacter rhizosphaerae]MDR6533472.1 diguanylate cyclase (GGDEF)-like protein [Caulobacter rhizosphaerae]